jgi:hypothetical protein
MPSAEIYLSRLPLAEPAAWLEIAPKSADEERRVAIVKEGRRPASVDA